MLRYATIPALAATLLVAGCGSSKDPSNDLTSARSAGLEFASCMRSHGVPNFPDPTVKSGPNGGIGVQVAGPGLNPQAPAFQAAQRKCRGFIGVPGRGR